jgi:hypothetical protein
MDDDISPFTLLLAAIGVFALLHLLITGKWML